MTHPATATGWDWDDGNERELAAHGITPFEVEQVFSNDPVWAPNRRHRAGDWKMVGRTDGGRRLTIVIRFRQDVHELRPITGWDATDGELTRYF